MDNEHNMSVPDFLYLTSVIEQDIDVCLQEIGTLLWIKRADFPTWESYYEHCLEKEKANNSKEVLEDS